MIDSEPIPISADSGNDRGDPTPPGFSISFEDFQRTRMGILQLPIGAVITGIPTIGDIRQIVLSAHRTRPYEDGPVRKQGSPELFLAEHLRKMRFYGKILDISVTRIPFDPSQFEDISGNVDPDRSYTFITDLGLHSTGRGRIGSLVVESSNAYARGGVGAYDVHRNRVLKGAAGTDVLDRLMAGSSETWATARAEALRKVISAGLPTLGKRR